MSEQNYFHLTLGPVQGFVAQARRTRDFWAGSFILSWLSGVAIASVKHQGGEISFPVPDDNFINALTGQTNKGPQQGGIPNRFKTEGLSAVVPNEFDPHLVVKDVRAAWQALARLVWDEDLERLFRKLGDSQRAITSEIWNRQVDEFWEITWAISPNQNETNLLDRRKNWRIWLPKAEPGVKCMLMDGWQELSGQLSPNQSSNDFWSTLSDAIKSNDLNKDEQLCSMAFIKRRFARYFEQLKSELPSGLVVHGWKLNPYVPSLPYLAAASWIEKAISEARKDETLESVFTEFSDASERLIGGLPETASLLSTSLSASDDDFNVYDDEKNWWGLDGSCFFPKTLSSALDFKRKPQKEINEVISAFNRFTKVSGMEAPSPFYALLLMDGDSLGKQMSDPDKQLAISESLNAFTSEVEGIVKSHSGFLVYAGGDDVLALLPMEKAIECAQNIRTAYDQCIETHGKACGLFSSISGAIQFAHFKTPFTKILHDAHSLLDDVAKDQTGRDALAVRVWKPGGLHLEWAQPWKHILDGDKNALLELVSLFADQKNGSKFSNGFIQRINELSDRLGMEQQPLSEDVFKGLMQAELVRSGIEIYGTHKNLSRDFDETKQNELIDRLVLLSRPYLRTVNESTSGMPEVVIKATNKVFSKDGPKLVRFLATKGLMEQGGDL